MYLTSELDGLVYVYALHPETGLLTEIQAISALPRDSNLQPSKPLDAYGAPGMEIRAFTTIRLADIHITPDGKWLYASERASSTIAAFAD